MPRTKTHLLNHLEIKQRALLQALRFEQLALSRSSLGRSFELLANVSIACFMRSWPVT